MTELSAKLIKPIDHSTLGRVPILSEADVELAISSTGLNLLDEVDVSKFAYWLNNCVERTIREQLRFRLTPKRLRDLRLSIETYRDLSRSLLHSEYPPPLPPPDWVGDVEEWIEKAEEGLDDRSSGGAAQNVEQVFFMPLALGLFNAGFGIVPDASTSRLATHGPGAAFRFIEMTRRIVHDRIEERGFSEKVVLELQKKARWFRVADDTLGKRLGSALKYKMELESWSSEAILCLQTGKLEPITEKGSGLAWQIHSHLFREHILRL